MATAGPNFAGAGSGWATTPGNITAADGAYAIDSWSRTFGGGEWVEVPTGYETGSSFGFAIGAGDTVNGITVEIKAKRSGPNGLLYAFLAISGVQVGAAKAVTLNSGVDTVFTLGSAADLWSGSWTGAQLAQLQVIVYASPLTGSGSGTVSVDYVKVTADYGDSTPNAFTFTDVTSQPVSTQMVSNSITVGGINVPAAVTVSGGEWEKNGSGSWGSAPGTVNNGDTVRVRHTSSASFSTQVNTGLTIGGVSDTFSSTTEAADTTPNAFTFNDVSGVEPSTGQISNTITVTGINSPASFSVTGGFVSKNGGPFNLTSGTVANGDTITASGTSSASFGGTTNVAVTIGGVSDTYTITTRAADTTPNQFTWTDVAGATVSTLYASNAIVVSGIEAAASLSFSTSGGTTHEYRKNGGAWTAVGSTTINNGDTLEVRMISPAGAGVSGNNTVNIGGVTDTYSVVTGADTTPDAFSFTTQTGAIPGVLYESNQVTITGINAATAVDVDNGGQASIAGGGYVSSGSITVGQTLKVRVRAPLRKGTSTVINVTVGTVVRTFTVTAIAGAPEGDI